MYKTPKSRVLVQGVTLNKTTLSLKVGGKETLTVTIDPSDATNKSITWTSTKETVATVSNTGEVTAVGAGIATITVTTVDGNKTAMTTVTVTEKTVAVTGVTLNKTTLSLKVGDKETLIATVVPTNATNKDVLWSSTKVAVATVSSTGEVTAIGVGTATITVTTADGDKTATTTVTVTGILAKSNDFGALIYGISQSSSKAIPSQAELDKIKVAKTIFNGLKASSGATVVLSYVKTDGDDTQDGSSWTKAKKNIKAALDAITDASASKTYLLLMGSGTYKPVVELSMKNHVAIIGGFKASNDAITGYDKGEVTTISGDNTGQTFNLVFNNNDLDVSGVPSTAVLARAMITKGNSRFGGGLYNQKSSPTFTEVIFSKNVSLKQAASFGDGGGGMHSSNSSPILNQVTFSSNHSNSYGGGMCSRSGSPILTNVTFSGNSTRYNGGGMYDYFSSILTNVTFSGNTSGENGGGMSGGRGILTNVIFSNNSATDKGGGMYNYSGSSILTNVTFSGNTSGGDGGGVYNSSYSPSLFILTNVTFSNNSATKSGGGMYNYYNPSSYSYSPSPFILTNVTFSNNSATKSGGGMYNSSLYSPSPPIIASTIFWGNKKGINKTPSQITNEVSPSKITNEVNSIPVIAHSIIQGATVDATKGGISNINPNLVALANNGGFVQTVAIGATSSAKDKGLYVARKGKVMYYSSDNTTWYITPLLTGTSVTSLPSDAIRYTTDARGYDYSGRPDIGAYEYGGTATSP